MTYCASPWQHSPVESMLHCLHMCFIPSYWLSDTTPVANPCCSIPCYCYLSPWMSSVMLQASAALKIMYTDCIRKHVTKNLKSRAGSDANDPSLHFTVMTKAFQVWIMCQPLAAHRSQRMKVLSSRLLASPWQCRRPIYYVP